MGRLAALRASLRTGFWALPTLCVLVAVVLALGLVRLDRALNEGLGRFTFGAGPDGAREVLSAITSSMITFTGLVFSITIVVLQLTSSQFSPRVLRTFLRDRVTQFALGVFVATFVYAVLVLRTVSSLDDDRFVPSVATTVGLGLLLLSVGMFVTYIHHVATAIQVSSIIRSIGDETRAAVDRRFPPGGQEPARDPVAPPLGPVTGVVPSSGLGVVVRLDEQALVEAAAQAGVLLRSQLHLGDFVPQGAPLLHVHDPHGRGLERLDLARIQAAVHLGRDRSMEQDAAFGFRQLVDIAEKALSPGINDPTTAVQALDELHDLLRRLATRGLRDGVLTDDAGVTRLVVPPDRFADYLALALDEVQRYGEQSLQVQHRVQDLLHDVEAAALPQHRDAVRARLKE